MQMLYPVVAVLSLVGSALALPAATTTTTAAAAPSQCTTTLRIFPTMNLSPTSTVYKKTITVNEFVQCSGCSLAVSTQFLGVGPVVFHTTTITVPKSTTTAYKCIPTFVHRAHVH
ncbi:hypothetical protein TWF694_008464 [Orbilia ellipsospora]|uniref:Uncharacterized protein n=1 Tax=Orbilia ellipsospora TaxID=2528407 RepID=A0AAV9XG56_9PEZI